MLEQLAELSGQRGETSDELRSIGEQAMEMGEDTRRDMQRRQSRRDRKLDQQLSNAGRRAQRLANSAQASASAHTEKMELAAADFKATSLQAAKIH